jgi:hypothetical protein
MSPEELLAHLDDDTLDPAGFHHEQHVAAAWAALKEPRAGQRICRGLRSLAERANVPEKYDERLTLDLVRLIDDRRQKAPDASWPDFRARFPELFNLARAKAALRELAPPTHEDHRSSPR